MRPVARGGAAGSHHAGIALAAEVRVRFFEKKCRELPQVEYPAFDAGPTLGRVAEVRRQLASHSTIDQWLQRLCDAIAGGARMLASLGQREFHAESVRLFGLPSDRLPDESTNSLGLALRFNEVLDHLDPAVFSPGADDMLAAEDVAG